MVYYMHLIFIVVAVSIDGFGVGMTYGFRNINLSTLSLLIIMGCSCFVIVIAMTVGQIVRRVFPLELTEKLGGFILICVGLFMFHAFFKSKRQQNGHVRNEKKQATKSFKKLTAMLAEPQRADKDFSGSISGAEAIILGIALALDAFGAGLAAALLGYSMPITVGSITLMTGLFIFSGLKLGIIISTKTFAKKLTYLPPLLLIAIGIMNVLS